MTSFFPRIIFLLIVSVASATVIIAQPRSITEAEYDSAVESATSRTNSTFPRIATTAYKRSSGSGVTRYEYFEAADRTYTKTTRPRGKDIRITEEIVYDGVAFERKNSGKWQLSKTREHRKSGQSKEELERMPWSSVWIKQEIADSNGTTIVYSRTLKYHYGPTISVQSSVNADGQLIEFRLEGFIFDRTRTIEFPKTVSPIKKPILGSKQDI